MKTVFVGPSLPDATAHASGDIQLMPPAQRGDVIEAVCRGATVLGVIDGNFETVPPIWHKEILYALKQGVRVFGASSMGALRAVECAPFGMIGIGKIYEAVSKGEIDDDAAVALLHGPKELSYVALSLPLVNVEATLAFLRDTDRINSGEFRALCEAARSMFFKKRTWETIFSQPLSLRPERIEAISVMVRRFYVDQKRMDALALIAAVKAAPTARVTAPQPWDLAETSFWRRAFPFL